MSRMPDGSAPTFAPRPSRGRWQDRGEEGFSLIELMVSLIIVGIVFTMTVIIVSTFFVQSASTQRVGVASETGQDAMVQIDQMVRSAVSPANVQTAAAQSPQDSCWGANPSVAPPGGVLLSPNDALRIGVISAHDFDIWFCGYRTGSTGSGHVGATVLEIKMDSAPGACANTDPQGGYCTLQIINQGPNCVPGSGANCIDSVLQSVPNVWCDAYCQGTAGAYTEEYSFNGATAVNQTFSVACQDQPTAMQPAGGCSNATPPLFQYFEGTYQDASGTGGQCSQGSTCSSVPLNPVCSAATGCVLPSYACTTYCTTPLDLSYTAAQATSGASVEPPALAALASIHLITVTFTAGAPSNPQIVLSKGQPGATLSNQVYLANQQIAGDQGCGYDSDLNALTKAVANWQMTDTGGSTGSAPVYDSSANPGAQANTGQLQGSVNTAGGIQEGVITPSGPLACNASSPAMSFPGGAASYMQTTNQYCDTSDLQGSANCPTSPTTGQPAPTGPQGFSVITWFRTSATPANSGIAGFGSTQAEGSTQADRTLSINASGQLTWTVCSGCTTTVNTPTSVTSLNSVTDGAWHMAVATIGTAPTFQPLQAGSGGQYLYLDGDLVGSAVTQTAEDMAGYWQVGDNPGVANSGFVGDIGRVAILPLVLTPQEVATLYDASGTAAQCGQGVTTGDQPLGYWPVTNGTTTGTTATLPDSAPFQAGIKTSQYPATVKNPPSGTHVAIPALAGSPVACDSQLGALALNASPATADNGAIDLSQSSGLFGVGWAPTANQGVSVAAWVNVGTYYGTQDTTVIANDRTSCTGRGLQLVIKNGGTSGFFSVGNATAATPTCDTFGQDSSGSGYTDNAGDGNASWTATTTNCQGPDTVNDKVQIPTLCANSSTTGYWYFMVGTYDGSTVRVYINGTQVAEVPYSGTIASPTTSGTCATGHLLVGADPNTCNAHGYTSGFADALTGNAANVAVYQTALTGAQVEAQYLAGAQT